MLTFTTSPTIHPNPNPTVPLAAIVRFAANRAVETTLAISDGQNSWQLHYGTDNPPENGLPVVGMRPNRTHQIQVIIKANKAESVAHPVMLTFTTPPLPDDPAVFPPIHINASQPERMEPGLTLVFARRRVPGEPTELTREERQFMIRYGLIIADSNGLCDPYPAGDEMKAIPFKLRLV